MKSLATAFGNCWFNKYNFLRDWEPQFLFLFKNKLTWTSHLCLPFLFNLPVPPSIQHLPLCSSVGWAFSINDWNWQQSLNTTQASVGKEEPSLELNIYQLCTSFSLLHLTVLGNVWACMKSTVLGWFQSQFHSRTGSASFLTGSHRCSSALTFTPLPLDGKIKK